MSEDLVLFRDEQGRPGLLGLHCSHRAADLSYGRLEDGGLRRLYHGWLYDLDGNCLEQPGEPGCSGSGVPDPYKAGSDPYEPGSVGARHASPFREKIHHTAYPCREAAGVVFPYMGPGEPPLLPAYEFFMVSEAQRWVGKYYHECNYLQGNEHLGAVDRGVAAARRVLLRAIRDVQEGGDPPHIARTPEENVLDGLFVGEEVVPAGMDWDSYRRQRAASGPSRTP